MLQGHILQLDNRRHDESLDCAERRANGHQRCRKAVQHIQAYIATSLVKPEKYSNGSTVKRGRGTCLPHDFETEMVEHVVTLEKMLFSITRKDLMKLAYELAERSCSSHQVNVLCGVPQGSILGPILFILYINDMCNVSTFFKPILFADDTNLFYSGKDIDELCSVISIELDKLCINQVNKLSLNTSKTNFMVFTKRSCDDTYTV